VAENDDHPERSTPTTEGVRILGAQEASAIEAERRAAMGEEDATEALPVTHADPDPVVEHAERAEPADDRTWAEMTSDDGPTWSASDADAAEPAAPSAEHDTGELDGPSWLEPDYAPPVDTPVDTPVGAVTTGEVEALPHWSEPPTGQVPVVGVDDTGSSPRFRDTGDDWSDSDVAVLSDDSSDDERLGAMSGREPPQPADDDETFVAQVRARRRSGTRAVVTSTPEARPMPRPGGRRAGAGAGVGGPAAAAPAAASGAGDVLPSSGRDLPVALLTAVIFGAVAVIAFTLGQTWTALLAAVVIAICGFELCAILQAKGLRPATLPVVVACAAAPLVPLKGPNVTTSVGAAAGMGPFAILFALVTVVSFVWFLWRVGPGRPVIGVAISVMVFCYVGGLGGYAGLLLQRGPDGVGLLFGTVLVVVAYDVVGYFAGSRLGSAPIAPNTSPGKTVEGTLAGVIASLLVAILLLPHLTPWKGHKVLVLAATGLLLGVAALVGDLCESMLKRDLGVKDFGTLLPGHGGFLDRFDGLLFALPVAYYVTLHLKMF
jgi:phosphatidate cytidylyltransferase